MHLHTGLVADARVKKHDTGPHHPEQAARFSAVMSRLEWSGLTHDLVRLPSRLATVDELALVHTRPYLALSKRKSPKMAAISALAIPIFVRKAQKPRAWLPVVLYPQSMPSLRAKCKMPSASFARQATTPALQ